jgi:hypothetical protein
MSLTNFSFSPSAQYLFNRAYAVNLAPPGQSAALQYGTIGTTPAPLRVKFEVEKTIFGASPNHTKIEIYNLSTQSRSSIKKGYLVQLLAGYSTLKNKPPLIGTIFTGNVYLAKSDRHGPEIVTSLECLDGGSAITYAVLDKSYGPGATLVQILGDIATAMSVTTDSNPAGISAGVAVGIPAQVYNNGFVCKGPCKDSLDALLKPQGLEWSIQNGNLNIIPKTAYDGNTAEVVSQDTGMIGVPSLNEYFVQFTSLLNPRLTPGALVQLISENTLLNGYYKIRKAKYTGDSHENTWQVACEATPMPAGSVQNLPSATGFNYATAVNTA